MDTGQVWGRWPRARERTLARTHDCVPLRFSSFSTTYVSGSACEQQLRDPALR